jgi:triosephosphate isomerase (TIM)
MRIPFIAGNWKMNTTVSEAVSLAKDMLPELDTLDNVEKVICPPFVSLVAVHDVIKSSTVKLGAQNLYFEPKGAYTGEISPGMLVGICEYVIIGHSERRQYFHENGELISKKVMAALKNHLKPILCVGENLRDYEAGKTRDVVTAQLESSLQGINQASDLTIAYEPVWAIGTGKASTGKEAKATIKLIRDLITRKYGNDIAAKMRILYGGSVTAANIAEFVSLPDIDGALVGGASLKAAEFTGIVSATVKIRQNT